VERERVVRRKVAASTFARGYLSGIVGSVFDSLQQTGFFYDPVRGLGELATGVCDFFRMTFLCPRNS
jgi:hypothetical protein